MPSHPLPCSYSVPQPPQTTGPALNAITPITDDQERRARHLRQCARLAEIAMEEVEAAHEEALDDIRMHADRRISPYSGEPAHLEGRNTTFAELVALLSRCVRQAILLEARLAAGAYDGPATRAGLIPNRPDIPEKTPVTSFRDRARRPPPPLSQAERSKQIYLQQRAKPASHPHKPP